MHVSEHSRPATSVDQAAAQRPAAGGARGAASAPAAIRGGGSGSETGPDLEEAPPGRAAAGSGQPLSASAPRQHLPGEIPPACFLLNDTLRCIDFQTLC